MSRNMRIGVIINRVYRDMNHNIITGILRQAYSLGYSAAVFSTEEENQDDMGTQGENTIFSLINFDLFDGFIFVPFTFINLNTVEFITNYLIEKCTKPVVCIGIDYAGNSFDKFSCIWQEDRAELYKVVEHLIQKHNCKSIICLTGPENSIISHERADGYRDAMKKAGLPINENDIIYGDFWIKSGAKLANDLVSGIRQMPDAIVCANDSMAFGLCDTLKKHGVKIPDDIRITGYDGSTEAQYHIPGICTYKPSYFMLGINSVCRLYSIITGNTCKSCCEEDGILLVNTSCGCESQPPVVNSYMITNSEYIEQRFLDNNMSNRLLNTNNLNDFAVAVSHWFFIFLNENYYENEKIDICLCTDWDVVDSDGLSHNSRTEGYSEDVISLYSDSGFVKFPSKLMFPPDHLRENVPSVSFFAPIHYEERGFGYAILTLYGIVDSFTMSYPRFCKDLGNSLECLCIRNRLKSMTYRAFLSETRDALTGAYRAATLPQFWDEITKKVKLYDETLNICLCSVSGLQQINEAYGQVEGDQILMQVAAIIMGCCHNGEICVRSAGNEFFLIGSAGKTSSDEASLESSITSQIERYNQTSGKPYRVNVYVVSDSVPAQLLTEYKIIYDKLKETLIKKKNNRHSRAEQAYYGNFSKLRHDIYSHPEEDWSVNICCDKLGMSMSHFQRIYKSIFNTSCMKDIQSSKLCHAKNLLLHTDETLQSIAARCGYDYSHFMRLFKKEEKMTPTEYRSGFRHSQPD